jgi:hypothetical protein
LQNQPTVPTSSLKTKGISLCHHDNLQLGVQIKILLQKHRFPLKAMLQKKEVKQKKIAD